MSLHWLEVQMVRFERRALLALVLVGGLFGLAGGAAAQSAHTSKRFAGAKVNGGTVTHVKEGSADVLRLSADFKVPDTPDPHWQVVDSKGTVYLLQRLPVKGVLTDRVNMQITLPAYIKDVAKVQIYCAWAEAVLGETTFDSTLTVN
jgi:hypothetical protein